MYGMTFGSKHSDSYNLILSSKVITSPKVKTSSVDIVGRDGALDFTEFFGEPKYQNREIELEFLSMESWTAQMTEDSTVKNELHGRKMHISFDDNPGFYWAGRISVGDWEYYKGAGKLKMTIDAEPYKYKDAKTWVTTECDAGDTSITLTNLRKRAYPTVTSDKAVTIVYGDTSYPIEAEVATLLSGIPLDAGSTTIKVTATEAAEVTIEYQEGSL